MAFTLFLVMSLPLAIKIHDKELKVHCISSEILSSHMIQRSYRVTGSDLIPACPFSRPTLSCLFPFIQLCLFPTLLLYCHCWVASSVWHCSTFLDSAVWQVWHCSTFLDNSLFSLRGLLRISTKSNSLIWMLSSATDLWWQQSRISQRLSLLELLHTKSLPWWVVYIKGAHTSPPCKISIGSWETHSFLPC